jgi:hypothetical protein
MLKSFEKAGVYILGRVLRPRAHFGCLKVLVRKRCKMNEKLISKLNAKEKYINHPFLITILLFIQQEE